MTLTTHEYEIAGGDLTTFIEFAAGDPYYLDFSESDQQGTISWQMDTVPYQPIEGGFKIMYDPSNQGAMFEHISFTVHSYRGEAVAEGSSQK